MFSALGHQQEGVIATQGAFAGFYAFSAPYRRRARVVVGLGCALAVAMAAGTLVASSAWVAVPVGAVLSAVAAGACLALRVGPPREYFIVFTFLIATALPQDAAACGYRARLVLLGALGAWLISMAGTLRDARAPEREAVDAALGAVARLLDAIGRPDRAPAARHAAVLAVQRAQESVADAGGAETPGGLELRRRADAAEALLEASLALMVERAPPLDPAWGRAVGALADGAWAAPVIPAPQQRPRVPAAVRLDAALRAAGSARRLDAPATPDGGETTTAEPSRWRVLWADLTDPRSPAPAVAVRLGVAVGLAGMLGYLLRAEHPTWIPLSAAAVLQGTNVALARQRALHRAAGTAVGVVVAAAVLAIEPGLVGLIVMVGLLQALTEAFILVSYGVAVVFITSLALLLLEIAGVGAAVHGLLDARLIDTALGCAIGFACGVLILPRRSRSRLAAVQARAIRTTSRALLAGLRGAPERERRAARRAVHLTLVTLDATQRDATGDALTSTTHADLDWPITHAVERLAHLSLALPLAAGDRPPPPPAALRDLELLLDDLASRTDGHAAPAPPPAAPAFLDWPRTERAVTALRDTVAEFSG
ncbi:FUSC family protein [Conexibacter woesei]|uniref:FUSC family protein n=1 Tax=Conexibacter woesei TaxID=191495 RepID=UPI0012DC1951|nr:FUSC family protein [Conexibacter woesei]